MIKVKVNDVSWQMPERFTIDEWIALQQWDVTAPSHYPWIISSISQFDAEDLKTAPEESLQLFMGFIIGAMNKRTPKAIPNFNKINFGQFVDLDCFVAIGVEKHIKDMMAVLEYETPWADEALACMDQFIMWRNTIYKQYAQLFGLDHKMEPVESDTPWDPKEVSRGWYNIIVDLAGEDILKMDQITEEPLQKVLTFLQIKKEKAIKEAQETRKIKQTQR